ncbi:hypothetical protein PFLUV_G00151710 [Perca fluviatilis]|uniref:PHD-type domain-containing protein n=1 Tax=Perca fluviatilis TaxID=8168 RepID=A0A6A5EYI7_PERFL|nr:hypothetical protein PFLUV_G00151710 [Perca fluviatilis]
MITSCTWQDAGVEAIVYLLREFHEDAVFDTESNCAMCATTKPPSHGPSITDWIQCDSCCWWFHAQCLEMDTAELDAVKTDDWDCYLCRK